jgi:hypothetical protein
MFSTDRIAMDRRCGTPGTGVRGRLSGGLDGSLFDLREQQQPRDRSQRLFFET